MSVSAGSVLGSWPAAPYFSGGFVPGSWLVVVNVSAGSALGSLPVALNAFAGFVPGSWPVAVSVSAGSVLGSSPVVLAVASLAVAAFPVWPAPALQALLAVPVSEVWLVAALRQA